MSTASSKAILKIKGDINKLQDKHKLGQLMIAKSAF
jgi:hypothetical protein